MSSRIFVKFLVIFAVLALNLNLTISRNPENLENNNPENKPKQDSISNKHENLPNNPKLDKPLPEIVVEHPQNKTASNGPNVITSNSNNKPKPVPPKKKLDSISSVIDDPNAEVFQSGAVTRGILVFVGLTFLFLLYAGFKTYRKRNRRSKRRTLLKRYGGKKYDVEMEPLPLSDEDDETIFELNGTSSNK